MNKADQFIEKFFLVHEEAPYDPAKAHDYYMRTRDLKGRSSGSSSSTKSTTGSNTASTSVATDNSSEQLREEAHQRFLVLKDKLKRMKAALAELVKEEKANASANLRVPDMNNLPKSSGSSSTTIPVDKKLSPQEKAKAAKASKEYYEKHKNDKKLSMEEQIADIKKQIQDVRDKIAKIINDRQARNGIRSEHLDQ